MSLPLDALERCAELAERAAIDAGHLIAASRPTVVDHKPAGASAASQVVTDIDRRAEDQILAALAPLSRELELGSLSEERSDPQSRLTKPAFWCVDPLDGTIAFVNDRPGYAVSIALVARSGEPLVGVVHVPTRDTLYAAVRGLGVKRDRQPWRPPPTVTGPLSVYFDQSFLASPKLAPLLAGLEEIARDDRRAGLDLHTDGGAVINALGVLHSPPACYVKLPVARAGGGSAWDFAATACIAREAGAVVSDVYGAPLDLNRADSTFMNHRGVLFATDARIASRVRELCERVSRP